MRAGRSHALWLVASCACAPAAPGSESTDSGAGTDAGADSDGGDDGCTQEGWSPEVADDEGDTGYSPSIAVGRDGIAHVCAREAISAELDRIRYATNAGGAWSTETILEGRGASSCAVALALDDSVHLLVGGREVQHGTRSGGAFTWETVDAREGVVRRAVVDQSSGVHAVYEAAMGLRFPTTGLGYATNASGGWVATIVEEPPDAAGSAGRGASLAVEDSGVVHLSYELDDGYGSQTLRHAWNPGGSWSIEAVADGDADSGNYTSIAVDASGGVHVSYYGESSRSLLYALRTEGVFTVEIADEEGGQYTSIALDAEGGVHVVYVSESLSVRHAARGEEAWTIETVDGQGDAGRGTSLAIHRDGTMWAAYREAIAGALRVARGCTLER